MDGGRTPEYSVTVQAVSIIASIINIRAHNLTQRTTANIKICLALVYCTTFVYYSIRVKHYWGGHTHTQAVLVENEAKECASGGVNRTERWGY